MQIYKTRRYFVNCSYCAQFYSRCHQSDQVISCRLLVFFIPINFFVCNAYHSWRCHISFSFGSYYGFCGYSSPVKLSIASEIGCLSRLDESEFIESWIRCFAPQGRAQKLRDNQTKKKKRINWHLSHFDRLWSYNDNFCFGIPQEIGEFVFCRNFRNQYNNFVTECVVQFSSSDTDTNFFLFILVFLVAPYFGVWLFYKVFVFLFLQP